MFVGTASNMKPRSSVRSDRACRRQAASEMADDDRVLQTCGSYGAKKVPAQTLPFDLLLLTLRGSDHRPLATDFCSRVHEGAVEAVAHIAGDKGGSHLGLFDDLAGEELIEGRVEDLDPAGELIGKER